MDNRNNIPEKFLKPYDPSEAEKRIYSMWEKEGLFNPETCIEKGYTKADATPFTIMMPPPNVTGVLHMGHAMMLTIEDIMIRYKRMQGFRTLWLPGTDHAAIATQSKVEKIIQKEEKKSRHDLGREELLNRVRKFAQESHDTIASQVRVMGSSCDWSREAFTLDEPRNIAVNTMFKKMYDDGLIYRGHRIVNWDPKGQTTIADDEIVYVEEKTKFYYFKYGPFTIGTARPETKFGDKYVVMHPQDKRYTDYKHGDKLTVEWINGPIESTIIKDEAVDMEFGTGVMTITPWHSVVDFELAEKHKLDKEQIIDEYGKLLPVAGEFAGLKIKDARSKIVEKLHSKGLLVDKDGKNISIEEIEDYTHNVSTAERTGGIIEPQIKLQWFVAVNKEIPGRDGKTLKDLMREPVASGDTKIIPEYFDKTYFHWIDNLRDWCISRQIWYGHRVPVWYRSNPNKYPEIKDVDNLSHEEQRDILKDRIDFIKINNKTEIVENLDIYCDVNPPTEDGWIQDEDTLDTWFSSSLWTFSTLGWPEKTKDLEIYHPTDVLETGYEILFFWVARMILMTEYALGTVPFKTVYLHGTVRDGKGQKMSKSLGNGIDPLDIAEKFGADAGRMALIVGTAPGTDSKISEDKIKGYKHFANKIWNITRFVLENTEKDRFDLSGLSFQEQITEDADKKHVEEFHALISEVTKEMDEYKFHLVAPKIYDYVWKTFADKIIEELKPRLGNKDDATNPSAQALVYYLLMTNLQLLHPFMPFVTEEIWDTIHAHQNKNVVPLIVANWPKS